MIKIIVAVATLALSIGTVIGYQFSQHEKEEDKSKADSDLLTNSYETYD